MPRRLKCSEHRFLEAWPRRPVETKAGTAKPDRTANGIAKISDRKLSRFGAHLRDVALAGVRNATVGAGVAHVRDVSGYRPPMPRSEERRVGKEC